MSTSAIDAAHLELDLPPWSEADLRPLAPSAGKQSGRAAVGRALWRSAKLTATGRYEYIYE